MKTSVLLLAFLASTAAPLAAADGLRLELSSQPDELLLQEPPLLSVRLHNDGNHPVDLSVDVGILQFEYQGNSGWIRCEMGIPGSRDLIPLDLLPWSVLKPRETMQLCPRGNFSQPAFPSCLCQHEHLRVSDRCVDWTSIEGQHHLRARWIHEIPQQARRGNRFSGAVVSNEITIRVVRPVGIDKDVADFAEKQRLPPNTFEVAFRFPGSRQYARALHSLVMSQSLDLAEECRYIEKGDWSLVQRAPDFSSGSLVWKELLREEAARWRIREISALPENLASYWAVADLRLQLAVEHLRLGEIDQAKHVLEQCGPSEGKTVVTKLLDALSSRQPSSPSSRTELPRPVAESR